jgi:hypothetical protein
MEKKMYMAVLDYQTTIKKSSLVFFGLESEYKLIGEISLGDDSIHEDKRYEQGFQFVYTKNPEIYGLELSRLTVK